jgi:hypothetical protein
VLADAQLPINDDQTPKENTALRKINAESERRIRSLLATWKAWVKCYKSCAAMRFAWHPRCPLIDLIILGTPVWAHNLCSPIRSYISEIKFDRTSAWVLPIRY